MRIFYFSWVRQKIGTAEEQMGLPPQVTTVGALAAHLASRSEGYAAALSDTAKIRAARNQEHVSFEAPISDSDEVAFFPPVTGG